MVNMLNNIHFLFVFTTIILLNIIRQYQVQTHHKSHKLLSNLHTPNGTLVVRKEKREEDGISEGLRPLFTEKIVEQ